MLKYFVSLFLLASSALVARAETDCLRPDGVVGAHYTITETRGGEEQSAYRFTILRPSEARLIYDMPATHLTQVYERYGNGRVKLLEYFHLEEIGVEHEPADPPPGREWPAMFELIPSARVASLDLASTTRFRCLTQETRTGTDNGATVAVEYLTEVSLPRMLRRARGDAVKTWRLESLVTDGSAPQRVVDRLAAYRLYDFADLGDSEHEEFFRSSRYLSYKLGHRH